MKTVIDTLFLRRPKIDYISPPVCEAIFSSSSFPIIILPDIAHQRGPTGLVLGGRGKAVLSWNAYPGALCYNIYSQVNVDFQLACSDQEIIAATGEYVLVQECYEGTSLLLNAPGCYRISAITADGESELSPAICTCECPECSCPDGQTFYPDYNSCLCDAQTCPVGQVWDPVQCKCVPCGSQVCPTAFFPDPANPCNCIPIPGGPVLICNDEQTAECPEGTTGDPVTIPAGTFCILAPNRLPDTVAAAKAEANAEAMAEAEDELECTPTGGWKICDYAALKAAITAGFAGCAPSANPEWDGVFNLQSSAPGIPGSVTWYFINQAIAGNTVAASDAPDYPDGDWQDLDCFTQLFYNPGPGTWTLDIRCVSNCLIQPWLGNLTNGNPSDPSGSYQRSGGSGPSTVRVVAVGDECCTPTADWSQLRWHAPSSGATPPATASVSPSVNPTKSDSFSVHADAPDNSVVPAASASNEGSFFYNGSGANCNLHLVFSKSGDNAHVCGGVTVTVGGFPVIQFFPSAHASGTYDLPFTLGDTGGVCTEIRVDVAAQVPCGSFTPDAIYSVHFDGTFTTL